MVDDVDLYIVALMASHILANKECNPEYAVNNSVKILRLSREALAKEQEKVRKSA